MPVVTAYLLTYVVTVRKTVEICQTKEIVLQDIPIADTVQFLSSSV